MGTDELAFSQEDFLAAAERIAPTRRDRPGVNALSKYLEQYRADAFAEDFAVLTTEDAVCLAFDLWEFSREQQDKDKRAIRVRAARGHDDRPLKTTVAEIVGPDMAFLVDSAIIACQSARIEIRAVLHPVMSTGDAMRSMIQIHLQPLHPDQMADLERRLADTYADVGHVNLDHDAMRAKMLECVSSLDELEESAERSSEEIAEAGEFLKWLAGDNFTFLGARDYTYAPETPVGAPSFDPESGLGILRDPARRILNRASAPTRTTSAMLEHLSEPAPVTVAKASFISTVHRRVHADYIGVKRFDDRGVACGETRFVGLFTSDAYTRDAGEVPLIRRKIARVKERFSRGSRFSTRRLDAVLKTFPRDELFQATEDDLARIAVGVLNLQIRPRTRLFIRRDPFDRYVSALLYTPRDNYNSDLRQRAHTIIADAFEGRTSAYYPSFGDGPLARIHLIVGLNPGHPEPDEDVLDLQMRQLFETWEGAVARIAHSTGADPSLIDGVSVTAAYREAFDPEEGLADILAINSLPDDKALSTRVWGPELESGVSRLKIYHRDKALHLAEIVPVLERMGVHAHYEVAYPIGFPAPEDGAAATVFVHDILLDRPAGQARPGANFEQAFEAVWSRRTENDNFNSLVIALGIDWRHAALLRTLCRYRSQSGLDPTELTQVDAMRNNPQIMADMLKMFETKFDPSLSDPIDVRRGHVELLSAGILKRLEAVPSLDEDRVLRRLHNLILAIQRTNFYLAEAPGDHDRHISIKIDSARATPLPAPIPYREIFVWSPEVEGLHLRFGPIARGGLRWSDRREDYRAEVLGLVKAQQVKNAVIVPVGAKGCFYPKTIPADASREQTFEIGTSAYKTFISALLQLTDNLVDGEAVRPERLIAWDGDDPYLVVAADKGTATFSDTANAISQDAGFWLDDAFASGGSAGYDHKKMGITARGAWEAVKRHFREMGRDTQSEAFDVIGIGDMSGDVFGNGMLLSKHIRLRAAFDHRHIFLDPSPSDLEATWNERKRLFDMGRSSWADYEKSLISKGGGVFERSVKSIPLSTEIQEMIGQEAETMSPAELINALLKSETDLLWFGGVGAYIKSSRESNADVSDKANDAIRVSANQVRAKVIGEGANLGVTQAGRIEFARRGGRINTDAIDNSAGVDSSDREVNIKILLKEAINNETIRREDRNDLLESMTADVAQLVLQNNYDQTGALSAWEHSAAADLDSHERLIEQLESSGKLDRDVEGLPSTEDFRALRDSGQGLTRPELAILMAYAKLDLYARIVDSDAPDDPALEFLLRDYFPPALSEMNKALDSHRLRREIIATRLSNRMVNLTGPTYAAEKCAAGADAGRLARAFECALEIFGLGNIYDRINELDADRMADAQILMASETSENLRLIAGALADDRSLLDGEGAGALIERYRDATRELQSILPEALSPLVRSRVEARAERYIEAGAPVDLARDVAFIRANASARETIEIARRTGWPLRAVALMQHQVGRQLGLDQMRAAARDLSPNDPWERIALNGVADDLPRQQIKLVNAAIDTAGRNGVKPEKLEAAGAAAAVQAWIAPNRTFAERLTQPAGSFESSGMWSLAKLVLLGDAVRDFVAVCSRTPGSAPSL